MYEVYARRSLYTTTMNAYNQDRQQSENAAVYCKDDCTISAYCLNDNDRVTYRKDIQQSNYSKVPTL